MDGCIRRGMTLSRILGIWHCASYHGLHVRRGKKYALFHSLCSAFPYVQGKPDVSSKKSPYIYVMRKKEGQKSAF